MPGEPRFEPTPVGPILRPARPSGTVILHLADEASEAPALLAELTGAAVLHARHRPVFPEALDDATAAYEYCASLGPVVLSGEGIGAGLAAALLVRRRDRGAEQPRCAVLTSPLLDFALDAPSLHFNASAEPGADPAALRAAALRYANGWSLTDPLLSPVHANLHGLPPLQLHTAGTDLLLDDSLAFAARAARSGVTVDLHVHQNTSALRTAALPTTAAFLTTRTLPAPTTTPA